MEMRAHSRTGGELASAELGTCHPIDAAIPRTEIAVGEHTVGKFAAQLQQARSVRRLRQRRASPDCLPARDKCRRETIKLGPKTRYLPQDQAAWRPSRQCGTWLGAGPPQPPGTMRARRGSRDPPKFSAWSSRS